MVNNLLVNPKVFQMWKRMLKVNFSLENYSRRKSIMAHYQDQRFSAQTIEKISLIDW